MPTTSTQESSQTISVGSRSCADTDLARALRQDLTSYGGPSITFGIMLAGGAYPIVLATIYLIAALIFIVSSWAGGYSLGIGLAELGAVLVYVVAGGVFGAFVGVVWAAIASALTMPVVYLFLKSLQIRGTLQGLGAVCGGLAGFVAVFPMTLSLPWTLGFDDFASLAMILAAGPGLTTILGQIGGAWGGRRAARYAVADASAIATASPELSAALGWDPNAGGASSGVNEPRLQFSIRHIMWIFVWLSLILSAIHVCRMPFQFVLPLFLGWFGFQLATLWIGSFLARRLGPWWAKRRIRRFT
jgi:hypothetical protein